ncbi:hypothetical protein QR680_019088 [Steinernema hermaphroditum]|uniref:Ig-like domain-containing protein n=1 Tax=Steinernema hermaphroditum TaxID=289476 RepID=A0AA39HJW8_9BILA|nr:hypothetical protein QR680_019088 [Steinernema hermaphroditum]
MDSSSSSPGSQPNAERPNVHNMTFHEIIARYKERYERTIYFYIKATHDDGSVTEITNLPMVARLNGQIIDFNTLDLQDSQSVQIDERHLVEKKDSEGHHTVITKDSRLEDMGTYLCKVNKTGSKKSSKLRSHSGRRDDAGVYGSGQARAGGCVEERWRPCERRPELRQLE